MQRLNLQKVENQQSDIRYTIGSAENLRHLSQFLVNSAGGGWTFTMYNETLSTNSNLGFTWVQASWGQRSVEWVLRGHLTRPENRFCISQILSPRRMKLHPVHPHTVAWAVFWATGLCKLEKGKRSGPWPVVKALLHACLSPMLSPSKL